MPHVANGMQEPVLNITSDMTSDKEESMCYVTSDLEGKIVSALFNL